MNKGRAQRRCPRCQASQSVRSDSCVPFTVGCRLHQRNHGSSHQSVCGVITNLNLATDFFGTHRWRDSGAPALAAAGVPEHVVAAMGRWGGATVRQYLVEAALAGSRFDGSEFNPIDT